MDEERFVSGRGNPRYLDTNSSSGEVAAQKVGFPSILDRFNDLLNKREEDEREEVIVGLYELVLSELSFNSKPIITDLTIIAGEHKEYAEGIADAICARILEAPVDQKLPSLYLLDSVVKNIGREYVRYFSSHLPEVFCEAYRQVLPNMRPSMRHLFGTWLTVFPAPVLRKIEEQLQFSPSTNHQSSSLSSLKTSESPRPIHGIHVNPKYLEARRQFELSTVDSNNQHARGMSSTLKVYGQKPTSEYEEDDFDNTGVMSSQVGTQRLRSTGRTSFTLGTENLLPSSSTMLAKYSSPFRIQHDRSLSPPVDEYVVNNKSPRRVVEMTSPSHFGVDYGIERIKVGEEVSDWSDSSYRRPEMSIAHNNGVELRRPRALIDAYGNDQRNRTPTYNPLKVDIVNDIDKKLSTKTWQNTEEKEFDWEDMSPTLADRGRGNDIVSSSVPPFESFRTRHGYGTQDGIPVDSNFRRSNWSSQSQSSVVEDASFTSEHLTSSGHGSNSRMTGLHDETRKYVGSRYPQEGFPHYLPQYSQRTLHTEGNSRNFRTFPSAGGEQKPLINSFPDGNVQFNGSSVVPSRIGDASIASWKSEALSTPVALSTWPCPPVNIQKSLLTLPPLRLEKQSMSRFDSRNASIPNQGPNNSLFPEHHFNNTGNKPLSSTKQFSFSSQQAVPDLLNAQNPERAASIQPPLLVSQEVRRNFIPPVAFPTGGPMPSLVPRLSHGYSPAPSNVLLNPIPGVHPSIPILNTPSNSLYFQGRSGFPPLPAGHRPDSSQMIPISHNPVSVVPQAGGALSGLISSLVAQGLISLTKQSTVQDSVGLEFNLDILKVRHESAITALYADLPRQCTTCGLRFKCQEQHSSHMDWHVMKNRISKTRKQKPSRKWFVSVSMWLTGTEALGTDAGPGFLPTESIVEKKDGEEFTVAADEDQNVCALCGEPFDDFYSDETEEWMYKGAVYMNAPNGATVGMDVSELGPIVHAKCRSESNVVSLEDFGQDEGGYTEDGSHGRKRLRS